MQTKIFAIFDGKAEAYLQPMFLQTKGLAIRAFTGAINDPKHPFSKHAADYTLFEIGEWDDTNAEFKQHEVRQHIGNGIEFQEQQTQIQGAAEMNDLMGERKRQKKQARIATN